MLKVVPKLFVTKDDKPPIFLNGLNEKNDENSNHKRNAITETNIKGQIPFADDNEPFISSR